MKKTKPPAWERAVEKAVKKPRPLGGWPLPPRKSRKKKAKG